MGEIIPLDQDLLEVSKSLASAGIQSAADGFSEMVGRKIQVEKHMATVTPVLTIPKIIARPDDDAVGVYLRFHGDIVGQMVLITPHRKAMELVDLLLDAPQGTSQQLGSLEKSALGELGNLCSSFFLNSVAKAMGASFRPSPPVVMVDMVGAILDLVVATTGCVSEHVLLVQANFTDGARCIDVDFWVIPDTNSLEVFRKKSSEA